MNKKKLISILSIVIILFSLYISLVLNKKENKISNTYYNLGTINEITLYDISKKQSKKILDECSKILTDIDNKMSNTIKNSDEIGRAHV